MVTGFSAVWTSKVETWFRVQLVMTTSIRFRVSVWKFLYDCSRSLRIKFSFDAHYTSSKDELNVSISTDLFILAHLQIICKSFFEICQFIFHQVQPHKNKHCAHAAANNNSTEIHYILLINLCRWIRSRKNSRQQSWRLTLRLYVVVICRTESPLNFQLLHQTRTAANTLKAVIHFVYALL